MPYDDENSVYVSHDGVSRQAAINGAGQHHLHVRPAVMTSRRFPGRYTRHYSQHPDKIADEPDISELFLVADTRRSIFIHLFAGATICTPITSITTDGAQKARKDATAKDEDAAEKNISHKYKIAQVLPIDRRSPFPEHNITPPEQDLCTASARQQAERRRRCSSSIAISIFGACRRCKAMPYIHIHIIIYIPLHEDRDRHIE